MFAFLRFFGFLFITIWYLTPILLRAALRGTDLNHALEYRQRWAHQITRMLGMRLRERGLPVCQDTCIYMGNHRSYTDPVIALRQIKAQPVAKAEVSSWPMVGFAARNTGVMFVKREDKSSRRNTLDTMSASLKAGFSVLIYPEGTTHIDPQTRPFRMGAFGLAAKEGFPIVPMAIEYGRDGDAWIGDDTFLPHFFRTFNQRYTDVWIEYGAPILDSDAAVLAQKTEDWINEKITGFREERLAAQASAK
ncbi:MAG: 1-acyl-sn-glycerol-3-phosphate acyltransferase [Saprospiraceae bacterium]|nr:1-acyl-sn-glycerol-3-phosphate acyltransferase [Saprospiraceae bacterium]